VGATGQSTGSSAASLHWSSYGELAALTNLRLLSVKIAGTSNSCSRLLKINFVLHTVCFAVALPVGNNSRQRGQIVLSRGQILTLQLKNNSRDSVADPDLLTPGSGIRDRFFPDLEPQPIFMELLVTIFWVKSIIVLSSLPITQHFFCTCFKIIYDNFQFCDICG
jgi:hypothetical protein